MQILISTKVENKNYMSEVINVCNKLKKKTFIMLENIIHLLPLILTLTNESNYTNEEMKKKITNAREH